MDKPAVLMATVYQRIVGAMTAVDHVLVEILETGKEKVAE